MRQLLNAGWISEGYRDDAQARAAFSLALGWLERYVGGLAPDADPVGLERVVAAKTGRLAFSGRVDRIDERPDGLVIVDYKTGKSPLTGDDARGSQALALYAFAAERTFRRPCRRVELHHLPTGGEATHEHTPESLLRQVRRAEQTAADALEATAEVKAGADPDVAFPGQVTPRCSWCDYRRICSAGADAPAKDPWASVEARLSDVPGVF